MSESSSICRREIGFIAENRCDIFAGDRFWPCRAIHASDHNGDCLEWGDRSDDGRYTSYTLAAFKKVAVADIEKVTLEFGVEIGGEMGIPYVTKGTAKSNLKIQIECKLK
jgi:Trypsin-co-occurring domain 1